MIHARIDTVDHRKILGFEQGTRAQFDARHGGDPLWFFLDSYKVKYRVNFKNFIIRPWNYQIDSNGELFLSDEPPIILNPYPDVPPGYQILLGEDGKPLLGDDGMFLYGPDPDYIPPEPGAVYLIDDNDTFVVDDDNAFITEPL